MRILVAEDSPDNRDLLTALLQSRGHSVTGVGNGQEVLTALEDEKFEVIFMDDEMPGMGGIEATRAIRKSTAHSGTRPMIIGVSGNSTEEDEKRCLAAGMDAFLAKPVGMHDVFQVLDLVARRSQPSVQAQTECTPADSPSETLAAHLHRATGGNQRIVRLLLKTFLADAPEKLLVLRSAIARKNAKTLATTAHSLKGSLGIVGAQKAAAIAGNLQAMGRSGDIERAAMEFGALENEFYSVRRELLAIQSATPPTPKLARKPAANSRRPHSG
jgi:protein-histidine pros-kinase